MKYFAMVLNLKDDPAVIEKYKEYHRKVWPEVLQALRDAGITRMRIFLKGRHEFMYCEARDDFDPRTDFQKYLSAHPRVQEWEKIMRELQEPVPEAEPGEWWSLCEPVFDLETALEEA